MWSSSARAFSSSRRPMMDKIKAYKAKLCEALEACMEEPVSSRSVSSCTMLMDALCKADKLTMERVNSTFTEVDAKRWTEHMENDDGSTGAHWTMEQTKQFSKMDTSDSVWYAAMNMMYSDYCAVARKYGLDRPDFYADMAHAFLFDKDAGGPEKKLSAYYHCIAEGEE